VGNKSFLFLFIFLMPLLSLGADITFSDEELPNESMPPRLDSPKAVINKAITFENRFEPKATYGWLMDEPFYQNKYLALSLSYGWNEFSGATLRVLSFGTGISDYANQFAGTKASLQFDRAPGPERGYSISYDYRLLYGKVSFSKQAVIPTTVISTYELGMIKYGDRHLPFYGAGLLNNYYIGKSWGINLGLRLHVRQAVDPLSSDLKAATPKPSESDFGTTNKFSTSFDLGLQFLF
jgi:outer membrane beta-barrel protein